MTDPGQRMQAARQAVFQACSVCRRVQARLDGLGRLVKEDRSPVTVADLASQALIAHTLRERLGALTLVGEEDATMLRDQMAAGHRETIDQIIAALRPEWPDATAWDVLDAIDLGAADPPRDNLHGFWTVDPIDGTRGFLRGEQYSISLAWIENGSPVLAVVGCPNLSKDMSRPLDDPDPRGTIYLAAASEGLFELPADDANATPLAIRRLEPAEDEPLRLSESVESEHTSHDDSERIMERLGEMAEPLRLDGQVKYVVVARGQADVYLRLPKRSGYVERIWDHAGGALVAQEGGCAVTDISGTPLDFGRGRGLEVNRGILAAGGRLHARLRAIIDELRLAARESGPARK